MTRFFIALAAGVSTTASLMAVHAGALPAASHAPVRVVTATPDGKPILLARMVVTATALPEAG